ncbi:hypothetical protein Hanom_Chr15g01389391 [Helianthus anomalus]
MDDVEEGEITPDSNEDSDRNSIRDEESLEGEKSPGSIQKDGMQQLHGDVDETVHGSRPDGDIGVGLENHYDTCFGGTKNLDNPNVESVIGDILHGGFTLESRDLGNNLGENLSPVQEEPFEGGPQDNNSRDYTQFGPHNSPGLSAPPTNGKRTRDQRSPPSVDSTQGPNIRIRHDRSLSDKSSLDLNRYLPVF